MSVTRADLIDFIRQTWRATGRHELAMFSRIDRYFESLAIRAADLKTSEIIPTKRSARARGGYSPSRRSVWLNRAAVNTWLAGRDNKNASDVLVFYDNRDFGRHIASLLDGPRKYVAATALSARNAINPRCVLVHGVADGIVWLGARTLEEIVDTMAAHPDIFPLGPIQAIDGNLVLSLTGRQRAFILQQRVLHASDAENENAPKRDLGIQLVNRDRRGDLGAVLPIDQNSVVLRHPALPATLPSAGAVHVRGRSGSGRTSAIRFFLQQSRRPAIVVDRLYRPEQRPLADEFARQHDDVVLVVDDLDQHHDALPWQPGILTVVSYDTDEEPQVRERYPSIFASRPRTQVDLDAVPDDQLVAFFSRIIEEVAPTLGITIPRESTLQALQHLHPTMTAEDLAKFVWARDNEPDMPTLVARRIVGWDARPATLIAFLRSQAGGLLHHGTVDPAPSESWGRRYRALSTDERAVITTLALLHFLGMASLREDLLRRCAGVFAAFARDEFHTLLGRLADDGWYTITKGTVSARSAHLHPSSLDLWPTIAESDSLTRFAYAVLENAVKLSEDVREHLLLTLFEKYVEARATSHAAVVATLWADRDRSAIACLAATLALQGTGDERAHDYRKRCEQYFAFLAGDPDAIAKMTSDTNAPKVYQLFNVILAASVQQEG